MTTFRDIFNEIRYCIFDGHTLEVSELEKCKNKDDGYFIEIKCTRCNRIITSPSARIYYMT